MKAITIHQPWATLIALGEKQFETRSWATKYRGQLAIHAAKKIDREACESEPFRSVLEKHGYTADNLPTGAVIGIGKLADCLGVGMSDGEHRSMAGDTGIHWIPVKSNEYHFGWYGVGRYAWELTDVKQIEPFPAKGQQGLWNWRGDEFLSVV
ncbi:ASCH domain-containing protein [Brevibacillus sp. H7]|uniref:ASCH domain-containing protein n=1 Tax=Brevibacillus sp. H7 TaxID=3349138 RepID=UPI00381AD4FC